VREAAGHLYFQMDMEADSLTPEQAWLLDMRSALRFTMTQQDASRALAGVDGFECVAYLQAAALDAMLKERLTGKYGPHYFKVPAAQQYLKSLWATGSELDASDFARRIGYADVDFGPLARQLRAAIQKKNKPLSEEEQEGN
jgi:hypothetical protein